MRINLLFEEPINIATKLRGFLETYAAHFPMTIGIRSESHQMIFSVTGNTIDEIVTKATQVEQLLAKLPEYERDPMAYAVKMPLPMYGMGGALL